MKNTLRTFLGLIALAFISSASAKEKAYPEQDPVLKYTVPAGWTLADGDADFTILTSKSGRVTAKFTAIPLDASMSVFKDEFEAVKKIQGLEGIKVISAPKRDTTNGLTSIFGAYDGKIGKTPYEFTLLLFNGGKGQSILCTLSTKNSATLSDTDKNGYDTFMASMKAHK
jgi:hypothetical protein